MANHDRLQTDTTNNALTKDKKDGYNKGKPIFCDCGRTVIYLKDNKVFVKCNGCKRWVSVDEIKKA